MQYHFPYDSFGPKLDQVRSPVRRRKLLYDFKTIKSTFDSKKEDALDMFMSLISSRNSKDELERSDRLMLSPRSPRMLKSFHEQYENEKEQMQSLSRSSRASPEMYQQQPTYMLDHAELLKFLQQFYESKQENENSAQQGIPDGDQRDAKEEKVAEDEKADKKHEYQKPAILNEFSDSIRDLTVHHLLEQCQDHFSVIDTCTILQQVIKDEMLMQGKLDDGVSQNLSAKTERLQQQSVFLDKVQTPKWVRSAIDDLGVQVNERALAYRIRSKALMEHSQTIQQSLDDHEKVMKSVMVRNHETLHKSTTNEHKKTGVYIEESDHKQGILEDAEVGVSRGMTFQQTSSAFEDIRKPWMKLLGLLEYQQEQYNETLTSINQVCNESETATPTENSDNVLWRKQLQRKDFLTKQESLEARKEHLETQLNCAKADLSTFEVNNKDIILEILNSLRQHRVRYDRNLRQSFQLLKAASLKDPINLKELIQHSDNSQNIEEKLQDNTMCVSDAPLQPYNLAGASPEAGETVGEPNEKWWSDDAKFAAHLKLIKDIHQTKRSADEPLVNVQERNPQSLMVKETKLENIDVPIDTQLLEFTKDKSLNAYGASALDDYKSLSDFSFSHAKKDVSVLEEAAEDEVTEVDCEEDGLPVNNEDLKKSDSPKHTEEISPTQIIMSICGSDTPEKESVVSEDGDKNTDSDLSGITPDDSVKDENCLGDSSCRTKQRSRDNFEKHISGNLPYLRTGKSMRDILSRKERRTAYFISKYAGGKHNGRAHLTKNLNGFTTLTSYGVKKECMFCEKYLGTLN